MTGATTPLAYAIAERALAIGDLPAPVLQAACDAILDTVGVMLAGASEPAVRIIAGLHSDDQGSVLYGLGRRASPLAAAEIGGAAAHVLDFDCVGDTIAGHPTVHVVPALLALGEAVDCDGATFVRAFVTALEVQARIARGITPPIGRRGWFSTSVLGTLGTAAGCAYLLRLNAEQTAHALGIAAMLAGGFLANAASGAKSLAAGHAARSGMQAALLARDGLTAAPEALEHRQGFLVAFGGAPEDTNSILSGWGDPYDVLAPGLWIKQYPCCGIAHAPIDLMLALRKAHGLTTNQVADVEILLHPQRVAHVDRPAPQDAMAAAFSIQYCLARTLASGPPLLPHFQGVAFRDPEPAAVMRRVRVAADPHGDAGSTRYGDQFGARLSIITVDGERLKARTDAPLGLGTSLSPAVIASKFLTCADRSMPPATAVRLYDAICSIDRARSMRAVAAIAMEDR